MCSNRLPAGTEETLPGGVTRAPRAQVTTWVGTTSPVTAGHRSRDDGPVTSPAARSTVLSAGVLAVLAGVVGAALHLAAPAPGGPEDAARSFWVMGAVAAVAYGAAGVVLALLRVAAGLAAVVVAIGLLQGTSLVIGEVAAAWLRDGRRGDDVEWLLWLSSWLWAPSYVLLVAVLPLVLPDGRLPSPRWRPVGVLGLGAVVAASAWWALLPYDAQDLPVGPDDLRNPVGVAAAAAPVVGAFVAGWCITAAVLAAASLVVRWRGSDGADRQRLGWVVLGGLTTFALLASAQVLDGPAAEVLVAVAMLPLPAACAVAAVRHGLWGVEAVLTRSMVYAVLAAAVVVGYVAAVAVLGVVLGATTGAPVLATVLVALGVLPLHARLQRLVNRLVHGDVEDPWTALQAVGDRLESTPDPAEVADRVLPELVTRVVRLLRVGSASVELTDGGLFVAGEGGGTETRVPLTYAGATVGALVVRSDAPLPRTQARLLDRLARQVAVAVHAALLARDAQRSRELVVAAREEERRRLRRDLHDGLGPSLAACALQAETARDLVDADPSAAVAVLDRLVPRLSGTVDDVRDLVHGLRPPTLDELGLGGAVTELAARFCGPGTSVDVAVGDGLGPGDLPAAVDVAAYRIVSEALANVHRHASAASVAVTLRRHEDHLAVEVVDDGIGLSDSRRTGVGLASMAERAAELGGRLSITRGDDGRGTSVCAQLPTTSRLVVA
jgi:two-component system NarL family sensor kinase